MNITIDTRLKIKPIDLIAILHHSLHQNKKEVMHMGESYSINKNKQTYTIMRNK